MILVLFVFPPLFCIGERTRMCSLSIINTYESSILEKYFSKLSIISNGYIVYVSSFCLLSVCNTNRNSTKKKISSEKEKKAWSKRGIEHAQGHIRQRQKIRLNTPVIVLVHATWLLSSLRVASYASRAETSHAHENLPLYILPLRGNFSREEKKLGQFARHGRGEEGNRVKKRRRTVFKRGQRGRESVSVARNMRMG